MSYVGSDGASFFDAKVVGRPEFARFEVGEERKIIQQTASACLLWMWTN